MALGDARPGELVDVEQSAGPPERRVRRFVVGKRLRKEPGRPLSVRLAGRELAQANDLALDRKLGIVPGAYGDMVGALAYHLQVEHEILRGLHAFELAQDVARCVMHGSRLMRRSSVEAARASARAVELDT